MSAFTLLIKSVRRFLSIGSALVLAGCVQHTADNSYYQQVSSNVVPESKVTDFRIAPCETLWALDDDDALTNSLYWLRAMDCADRMSDAQARFQAQQIPAASWVRKPRSCSSKSRAEISGTVLCKAPHKVTQLTRDGVERGDNDRCDTQHVGHGQGARGVGAP